MGGDDVRERREGVFWVRCVSGWAGKVGSFSDLRVGTVKGVFGGKWGRVWRVRGRVMEIGVWSVT